jgi:hypothetical protein
MIREIYTRKEEEREKVRKVRRTRRPLMVMKMYSEKALIS